MQSVARLYRSPGRKSGRQGDEHVPLGDPSDATKADDRQIVSNLNAATGAWTWVSSDNDTVVGLGVKDPLNNYVFEVHQYLDADGGGGTTPLSLVRGRPGS